MKIYDISQEVFACRVYPGDPIPEKKILCSTEKGDLYNLTAFSMCAHNGTHIDAPFHFLKNGKTVDAICLEAFVGMAYVAEHHGIVSEDDAVKIIEKAKAKNPEAATRILIKGDAEVSSEAAKAFASSKILLLGNESQTVGPENAPMAVHRILLSADVILLEGIRLTDITEGVYFLNAAPLNLSGADGSPCRAILIKEESQLHAILSNNGDIASEILQMFEDFNTDEMISLDAQLQNELIYRLAKNPSEEIVWDTLLPLIQPDQLSENLFHYLVQNQISLLTLCHMPLQDKWLMKLVAYDDAPIYTLAKRYYLSDKYSPLDFMQFYNQYLRNNDDIALHLLDLYGKSDKRGLLIFLCSNNKEFKNKEKLQWYQVAEQVRGMTNSSDIQAIYRKYNKIGIILNEIASNYFTPKEILSELLSVKEILYANKIRKNSEKTLKIKQSAEQI